MSRTRDLSTPYTAIPPWFSPDAHNKDVLLWHGERFPALLSPPIFQQEIFAPGYQPLTTIINGWFRSGLEPVDEMGRPSVPRCEQGPRPFGYCIYLAKYLYRTISNHFPAWIFSGNRGWTAKSTVRVRRPRSERHDRNGRNPTTIPFWLPQFFLGCKSKTKDQQWWRRIDGYRGCSKWG